MTTLPNPSGPDVRQVVARAVRDLSEVSGMPVTFGGQVARNGRTFIISELHGTRTQSLRQLRVRSGMGLGGKALQLVRPAMVQDYANAQGITHRYDKAVAQEQLQAVVAVPVQVKGAARAMVYVASRGQAELGDRLLDQLSPVLRKLERDLTIEEEVHRRVMAAIEKFKPSPQLLSVAAEEEAWQVQAELAMLAESVVDGELRTRLRELCDRVACLSGVDREPPPDAIAVQLTQRERDVLSYVSIGCTNDDIAERLGLLPNTVKAYVKTAIRKLGGANRFQAARRARRAGWIEFPGE